jgi:uncharacterized protein
MVSVNVAQLLKSAPGETREFTFAEALPDAAGELRLHEPVRGRVRLTRTSDGILVRTEYRTALDAECARCLDPAVAVVRGAFEEEFLPTQDVRTGLPSRVADEEGRDQPRIDENHEIQLDDLLRQDILTGVPLQPLCAPDCPGLCPECGERLGPEHAAHPEAPDAAPPESTQTPFANLAELLRQADSGEKRDRNARRRS